MPSRRLSVFRLCLRLWAPIMQMRKRNDMKLPALFSGKRRNLPQRAAALVLAAAFLVPQIANAESYRFGGLVSSLGTIQVSETRTLSPGVVWNNYKSLKSGTSPLVVQSVTIDATNPAVEMRTFYGTSVTDRETLSKVIGEERKDGEQVVAGINGDFFTLATGTPSGLLVHNGELLSSDGNYAQCFGIREDGTALIGDPSLAFALKNGTNTVPVAQINKDQTNTGPYLFTDDFGATTGTTVASREVVLQSDGTALAIGGSATYKVVEIRENVMATPIGKNQAILSARVGQQGYDALAKLKVGDTWQLVVNDLDGKWTDVRQAIGGRTRLVKDGAVVSGLSTTNVNPMTLIGVRDDGQIVIVEADGRQSGYSTGISHQAAAAIMLEAGCVDALELDGGGSSTVSLRTPGYVSPSIVNKPSDGSERAVSNGLLVISKSQPSATVDSGTGLLDASAATQLHIYPGKTYLMPGCSASFNVAATDDVQYPAKVPSGIQFTTKGAEIRTNTGTTASTQPWLLIAGTTPGLFALNAASAGAAGTAEYIVVSQLTSIRPSQTALYLAGGQSVDLSATGLVDGIAASSKDSLFSWAVTGNVGTVTQDGVFTASEAPAAAGTSGAVTISYAGATASVSISIASKPIVLDEFETASSWATELLRATSAKAVVRQDAALARYGSGFLELTYNHALPKGTETGAAGAYAGPAKTVSGSKTPAVGGITIPNSPTALSMWIYGDGSNNWLRSKITDATGKIVDLNWTTEYKADTKTGGIDWTGWKYVTAQIPSGLKAPLTLSTPIRVMCTTEAKRTSGVLRFDRLKAIYINDNTDLTGPVVGSKTPAENAVLTTGAVSVSGTVSDGAEGVGVRKDSIQMKIDGVVQKNAVVKDETGGYGVLRAYDAKNALSAGYHVASISSVDQDGNPSTVSWGFTVDSATPSIRISAPAQAQYGETFTVDVMVKNPNTLRTLAMNLKYDTNMLELIDADKSKAGLQASMEKWVASGRQVKHSIDQKTGTIAFEVQNLNSTLKLTERKAYTLTFRMKKSAVNTGDMILTSGSMLVSGHSAAQTFALPRMQVASGFALKMSVEGLESGQTTVIRVVDAKGAAVSNASILMPSHGDGVLLKTGADGSCSTTILTMLPVGTAFTLKAVSGTLQSDTSSFTVLAASSGKEAEEIDEQQQIEKETQLETETQQETTPQTEDNQVEELF